MGADPSRFRLRLWPGRRLVSVLGRHRKAKLQEGRHRVEPGKPEARCGWRLCLTSQGWEMERALSILQEDTTSAYVFFFSPRVPSDALGRKNHGCGHSSLRMEHDYSFLPRVTADPPPRPLPTVTMRGDSPARPFSATAVFTAASRLPGASELQSPPSSPNPGPEPWGSPHPSHSRLQNPKGHARQARPPPITWQASLGGRSPTVGVRLHLRTATKGVSDYNPHSTPRAREGRGGRSGFWGQ